MIQKINHAFGKAIAGERLGKQEIIELLQIESNSDHSVYLQQKANEAAHLLTDNKAYMWGAIGLDYANCVMNCDFCSFGSAWGLIDTEKIYSADEILQKAEEYITNGVHFITLRTTQHYPLSQLTGYIREIRERFEGDYEIVVNIGEFDDEKALQLAENGVNGVYHAIRLREGINTRFDIEERLATIRAINQSPLDLIHLVEPVGIEHTCEEIAERFISAVDNQAYISGIIARIPVPGTPLGDLPQLKDEEIAKMIAILRLSGGRAVKHICVHPASPQAIQSGANVVVIETGAIPRDQHLAPGQWNLFDYNRAKQLFENNGYELH